MLSKTHVLQTNTILSTVEPRIYFVYVYGPTVIYIATPTKGYGIIMTLILGTIGSIAGTLLLNLWLAL